MAAMTCCTVPLVALLVVLGAMTAGVTGLQQPPAAPSPETCSSVSNRLDCGFAGITPELCQARSCCYDKAVGQPRLSEIAELLREHRLKAPRDSPLTDLKWAQLDLRELDEPSCFYSGNGTSIKKVHVIQSNHFDAGYADLTVNIVNEYFDTYFPRAASIGAQLRQRGGQERLRWMTQSYLVSLYLDCPPSFGLHCPNSSAVQQFKEAVAAGDITWHAFPHNAELSALNNRTIAAAIKLTHDIDDKLNQTHKTVLSQRDVPGMPRSAVPHLANAGVRAVSEGSNGRVFPVNVPPAFVWRDPATNTSLLGLWHAYDYGVLPDEGPGAPARDTVVVPGMDEALIYDWRGDNAGPPTSVDEVVDDWKKIAKLFPGAQIVSSTLDDFIDVLEKHRDVLPVIEQDLCDTWVMGMPSDPVKSQRMRIINRQLEQCLDDGSCSLNDPQIYNFSRLAIKNSEHTWGLHVQDYGPFQTVGYPNSDFHSQIASGKNKYYTRLASSWIEQRNWGYYWPMQALKGTKLGSSIEAEVASTEASTPNTDHLVKVPLSNPVVHGFGGSSSAMTFVVGFNASGAIVKLHQDSESHGNLVDEAATSYADASHPLGLLRYQTLTDDDFANHLRADYLRPGTGGENEYGRPNCTAASGAMSSLNLGNLTGLWRSKDNTTMVAEITFADNLHVSFGAPAAVYVTLSLNCSGKSKGVARTGLSGRAGCAVEMTVDMLNKTSTRYPEATYFTFSPVGNDEPHVAGRWLMDKVEEETDVLDVAMGGGRGLHAVLDYVKYSSDEASMVLETLDVPVVSWGPLYPFPQPLIDQPDTRSGASFVLHANPWNTNYPFWYPFVGAEEADKSGIYGSVRYRFRMHLM